MFRQIYKLSFGGPRIRTSRSPKAPITSIIIGVSGTLCYLTTAQSIRLDGPPDSDVDDPDHKVGKAKALSSSSQQKQSRPSPIKPADLGVFVRDRLQEHEGSHVCHGIGISRYDIITLARYAAQTDCISTSLTISSNNPSEDDHSEAIVAVPQRSWAFFAVLDGHNGWETSRWLREDLLPAVIGAMADLYSKFEPSSNHRVKSDPASSTDRLDPPPEVIDETIKDTFKRLDDDIVNDAVERVFASPSKSAAINLLARAHAGSCALMAFYDSHTRQLRVALTGDSRAVLGRPTSDKHAQSHYDVHVLSSDQNGNNAVEQARLSALHPGETVCEKGRVLGWGMSRAFGDAAYKWSREMQERLNEEFLGDRPRSNVKTPPYFTAEPEITTTDVKPGDFLVLASDGLWDCLTNEEAVGLVGLWLNQKKQAKEMSDVRSSDQDKGAASVRVVARDALPVNLKEDDTGMYRWWRAEKRFVNVDENAATHLTRNALGGADSDLTAALLSMTMPRSRRYRYILYFSHFIQMLNLFGRDDITITVVFFDDD